MGAPTGSVPGASGCLAQGPAPPCRKGTRGTGMAAGPPLPESGFKPQLHTCPLCAWGIHLPSLGLSLPICKMRLYGQSIRALHGRPETAAAGLSSKRNGSQGSQALEALGGPERQVWRLHRWRPSPTSLAGQLPGTQRCCRGGHRHPACSLTPSPGLSSGNSSLLPARVASSPPHGTWVWSMNLLLGLSWTPRRRFLVSAEAATLVDGSLEVLVTSLPPLEEPV